MKKKLSILLVITLTVFVITGGMAVAQTTDDGSSEVINAEDGTAEDGTAEDGTAEDGTAEDGTAEDGTAEDGTAEDGTAEDGEVSESFEDITSYLDFLESEAD